MSLSTKLRFPYLIFNFCYQVNSLTATQMQIKQRSRKLLQSSQYSHEHKVIPIGDTLDLVGKHMFIPMRPSKSTLLIASLAH